MNNTTTDAAEARAKLTHHEQMLDAQKGCVPCKLCGSAAVITDAGPGSGYYVNCSNYSSFNASKGCMIDQRRLGGWAYNVMDWWNRLHATAEAASGAGEREESWTGDPHRVSAELRRVASKWKPGFRLPQLLRDAADEIDCLSTQASLPPATDPAIPDGWKLVPVEPTGEMAAAGMAAINDTDLDGPSVWSAMLAAAPTIPATGEAVKWRERWYGSDPWKGSAITDEYGNLIAYFGGDEATHAAVTKAVTAHNATIPATGHAATEGEGA